MSTRVAFAYSFHDRDWFGGRNYFASLFHAMQRVRTRDFRFVLVTGTKTETSLPSEFPFLDVIRTTHLDRYRPRWIGRQLSLRICNTDPLFARFLRKEGIDILSHSGQLGRKAEVRTAEWLYDFQFMHLPEFWQPRHKRWAEQRYRAACRNSDALIVSSQSALDDLNRFAPWCTRPKYVLRFVSNPVDLMRIPGREDTLRRYELPPDYFYLPNQFWKNKNHKLAIDALCVLRDQGVATTVVCTGKTFDGRQPGYFKELMDYCAARKVGAHFRVLGVVPYRDTQALMAHARAVINPSRFEGWSTTVEEAKTMRKALLLSDLPVHREQSPELGRFFDVDDEKGLASLMRQCLEEIPAPLSSEELQQSYAVRLRKFGEAYISILTGLSR